MSGKKRPPTKSGSSGLFVGFDAFASQFGAGSVAGGQTKTSKKGASAAAPVYTGNDAEFAQVLKRLNKKSATTKVKALEDLSASFMEKPKTSLRDVAAVWAYHCPGLSYYPDTRVRRAAAAAFLALSKRSKSVVGSFAAELLPSMLLMAQDGDREVHAIASQMSEQLLPSDRLAKVLGKVARPCLTALRETALVSQEELQERLALGEQDAEESGQRARLAAVRALGWVCECGLGAEAALGGGEDVRMSETGDKEGGGAVASGEAAGGGEAARGGGAAGGGGAGGAGSSISGSGSSRRRKARPIADAVVSVLEDGKVLALMHSSHQAQVRLAARHLAGVLLVHQAGTAMRCIAPLADATLASLRQPGPLTDVATAWDAAARLFRALGAAAQGLEGQEAATAGKAGGSQELEGGVVESDSDDDRKVVRAVKDVWVAMEEGQSLGKSLEAAAPLLGGGGMARLSPAVAVALTSVPRTLLLQGAEVGSSTSGSAVGGGGSAAGGAGSTVTGKPSKKKKKGKRPPAACPAVSAIQSCVAATRGTRGESEEQGAAGRLLATVVALLTKDVDVAEGGLGAPTAVLDRAQAAVLETWNAAAGSLARAAAGIRSDPNPAPAPAAAEALGSCVDRLAGVSKARRSRDGAGGATDALSQSLASLDGVLLGCVEGADAADVPAVASRCLGLAVREHGVGFQHCLPRSCEAIAQSVGRMAIAGNRQGGSLLQSLSSEGTTGAMAWRALAAGLGVLAGPLDTLEKESGEAFGPQPGLQASAAAALNAVASVEPLPLELGSLALGMQLLPSGVSGEVSAVTVEASKRFIDAVRSSLAGLLDASTAGSDSTAGSVVLAVSGLGAALSAPGFGWLDSLPDGIQEARMELGKTAAALLLAPMTKSPTAAASESEPGTREEALWAVLDQLQGVPGLSVWRLFESVHAVGAASARMVPSGGGTEAPNPISLSQSLQRQFEEAVFSQMQHEADRTDGTSIVLPHLMTARRLARQLAAMVQGDTATGGQVDAGSLGALVACAELDTLMEYQESGCVVPDVAVRDAIALLQQQIADLAAKPSSLQQHDRLALSLATVCRLAGSNEDAATALEQLGVFQYQAAEIQRLPLSASRRLILAWEPIAAGMQLARRPGVSFFHGSSGLRTDAVLAASADWVICLHRALLGDDPLSSGQQEQVLAGMSRLLGFENAVLLLQSVKVLPGVLKEEKAAFGGGAAVASDGLKLGRDATTSVVALLEGLHAIHTGLVSVSSSLEGKLPSPSVLASEIAAATRIQNQEGGELAVAAGACLSAALCSSAFQFGGQGAAETWSGTEERIVEGIRLVNGSGVSRDAEAPSAAAGGASGIVSSGISAPTSEVSGHRDEQSSTAARDDGALRLLPAGVLAALYSAPTRAEIYRRLRADAPATAEGDASNGLGTSFGCLAAVRTGALDGSQHASTAADASTERSGLDLDLIHLAQAGTGAATAVAAVATAHRLQQLLACLQRQATGLEDPTDSQREWASSAAAAACAIVAGMGVVNGGTSVVTDGGDAPHLGGPSGARPDSQASFWVTKASVTLVVSSAIDLLWHAQRAAEGDGEPAPFVLLSRGYNPRQGTALLLGALSQLHASDWVREARIAELLGRGRVVLGALDHASRGGRMKLKRGAIKASDAATIVAEDVVVWPIGLREWISSDLLAAEVPEGMALGTTVSQGRGGGRQGTERSARRTLARGKLSSPDEAIEPASGAGADATPKATGAGTSGAQMAAGSDEDEDASDGAGEEESKEDAAEEEDEEARRMRLGMEAALAADDDDVPPAGRSGIGASSPSLSAASPARAQSSGVSSVAESMGSSAPEASGSRMAMRVACFGGKGPARAVLDRAGPLITSSASNLPRTCIERRSLLVWLLTVKAALSSSLSPSQKAHLGVRLWAKGFEGAVQASPVLPSASKNPPSAVSLPAILSFAGSCAQTANRRAARGQGRSSSSKKTMQAAIRVKPEAVEDWRFAGGDAVADASIDFVAARFGGMRTTDEGGEVALDAFMDVSAGGNGIDALDARRAGSGAKCVGVSDPGAGVSAGGSVRQQALRAVNWTVGSKTVPPSSATDRSLAASGMEAALGVDDGGGPGSMCSPDGGAAALETYRKTGSKDTEPHGDLSIASAAMRRTETLWAALSAAADGGNSVAGSLLGSCAEARERTTGLFPDLVCAAMEAAGGAIHLDCSALAGAHGDVGPADFAAALSSASGSFPGSDSFPGIARAGMASHPWSVAGLSGELLHAALEGYPAKAASWARGLQRQQNAQLRAHVKLDVQPRILSGQQEALKVAAEEQDWEMDDFSVKVHGETGEVVATYVQDEVALKATIEVPPAYPLDRPRVQFQCGLGKSQWQRWRMQLMALLTSRDGTFADAVALWKKNLDQELAGAEPCPICYSVISLGTMRLPTEQCGTCRKGFHGACVLRWFQSSGDNKCPMCRSEWARYQSGH